MKKVIAFSLCSVLAFSVFAEETEILLPDLTTVITGSEKVTKVQNEIELTEDIVIPPGSGEVVPELPEVDLERNEKDLIVDIHDSEKNVFAEGKIGAGLPGNFTGDFSLYRTSGKSPFRVSFMSDSCSGYAGNKLSSGYSDSKTEISAEKTISIRNIAWNFGGLYKAEENGLQGKSNEISEINNRVYNTSGKFAWALPHGFVFSSGLDFDGYIRFADLIPESIDTEYAVSPWVEETNILTLAPNASISWTSDVGFSAAFSGNYWLDTETSRTFAGLNTAHRGLFDLEMAWKNEFVKIYGMAGALIGNNLGSNGVIVPFTLGLDAEIPVHFSNRMITLNIAGGLESEKNEISVLETENDFSGFSFLPSETSDWYGSVQFMVPLKNNFSALLDLDFKRTACGNGQWEPEYGCEDPVSGIYDYIQNNRTRFDSNLLLNYRYKYFSIAGGWESFWMTVPAGKDKQSLVLAVGFGNDENTWGIKLNSKFGVITDDFTPTIGLDAFYGITDQVSVACEVTDAVKLLGRKPRMKTNQYAERSGTATLLVKFLF